MRKPIPHVKPGDVITAELFNAVAERLERRINLTVAQGSGLVMSSGPWGKALGLALPRDLWAQISGSSSPYSWVEVAPTSGGGWATFGNRSGTANAYEINGKSGLDGRVVRLARTSAGDWRFDAECLSCGPPPPSGCYFCLTPVTDVCTSAAIVPTSAVLKVGGVTQYTATIDDQVTRLSVFPTGSGYSNGWHTLTFTGGGGTGAAGEAFVSSGQITQVVVTNGGSGYTSAPTVSIDSPGGGSGASITATVGDAACFAGVTTGTAYELVMTATGYRDTDSTLNLVSCANQAITMVPATFTPLNVTNVVGCSGNTSGIEVTATQGATVQTATTDSSGDCSFTGPWATDADITLSFHDPEGRFSDHSYTYTPTNCSPQGTDAGSNGAFTTFNDGSATFCGDTGDVVSGYACLCSGGGCFYPVATTLHMSDSLTGATGTLTYSCTGSGTSAVEKWTGTLSIDYGGCSGNDGMPYSCPAGTVTVNVTISRTNGEGLGNCAGIELEWTYVAPDPAGAGVERCPEDGGTPTGIISPTSGSLSCYPAFSWSGTVVSSYRCGDGYPWGAETTITITE